MSNEKRKRRVFLATCIGLMLALTLGNMVQAGQPQPSSTPLSEKILAAKPEKELEVLRAQVCHNQPTTLRPVPAELVALCGRHATPTETPSTLAPEVQRGPVIVQETQTNILAETSIAGIATLSSFGALVWNTATDFPADVELLSLDLQSVYQLTDLGVVSKYSTSGVNSAVSNIAPPGVFGWTDMAVDPTTGTAYGVASDCSTGSSLSTLNLLAGTSALIGNITGSTCMVSLMADNAGNLYGHDILTDTLIAVNKVTGAGTSVGALGFNSNFGQSADCDPDTGICYLFAFDGTAFAAQLRSVDLTTGATTLVGTIGSTSPGGTLQASGGVFGTFGVCTTDADCQDGNLCNGVETCSAPNCLPGTPVDCSDGQFCTDDICDPGDGSCTNPPLNCDDLNQCTNDSCDESGDACVNTPNGSCIQVCNASSITILDNAAGAPYPSPIPVAVPPGAYNVTLVQLLGIAQTFPDDVDILLAGPGGQNLLLVSDVGGSADVTGINLDITDGAATTIPDGGPLVSGSFKPSNVDTTTDVMPAPAPAPSAATTLSIYNFTDPNGTWNLWVRDDAGGDTGAIAGGWCIRFVALTCTTNADCNDANACTTDSCNTGTGFCNPPVPIDCNDGQVCTVDGCNPATGCTHAPNPCNDGDGCTNDSCDAAGCHSVPACLPPICNPGAISIAAGPGVPYPSTILVGAAPLTASIASVQLLSMTHTFPDDIDIMVQGPTGPNTLLVSDVGGGTDIAGISLTLTDSAATTLTDAGPMAGGTFKPSNIDTTSDAFPAAAPAPGATVALSVFTGTDPNGTWNLYVRDDSSGDTGTISGGWCLNIGPCALPLEVNDSLTVSKPGGPGSSSADIAWSDGAGPFNVYKGSATGTFAYNHACFAAPATSPTTDAAVPAASETFYYLVGRKNGCGESVLGRKSNSDPVPAAGVPCP